jgi:hypothetical protein
MLSRVITISVGVFAIALILAYRGLPVFFLLKAIPLFVIFIFLFLYLAAALGHDRMDGRG